MLSLKVVIMQRCGDGCCPCGVIAHGAAGLVGHHSSCVHAWMMIDGHGRSDTAYADKIHLVSAKPRKNRQI